VFRHEVILRIKSGVPREMIEQTLRQVAELIGQIPGVERVRTGTNNVASYRHAMIVVDLRDELALRCFQRHPLHVRAVHRFARLAEATAVGSYLVGSEHRR
jgi:hypothetical protein